MSRENHVQDWYISTYPDDELGQDILDTLTFAEVYDHLKGVDDGCGDIYEVIGVGDSLVRELIFSELCKRLGTSYEYVYNLWVHDGYDMIDLPERQPIEVREIIDRFEQEDNTYESCQNLVDELKTIGWSAEYGLDAIPYNLRKVYR